MNVDEVGIGFALPEQDQAVTLYVRDQIMAKEPLL